MEFVGVIRHTIVCKGQKWGKALWDRKAKDQNSAGLSYKVEKNTGREALVYAESENKIHAGWVTDFVYQLLCSCVASIQHEACDPWAELSSLPYLSHNKVPHPPCERGYSRTASYKQHRQSNLCAKSVLGHASLPVKQINKQTKISSRITCPATTSCRKVQGRFFPSVSVNSPPQKKEVWQIGILWKERGNRTANLLEQCICQNETT